MSDVAYYHGHTAKENRRIYCGECIIKNLLPMKEMEPLANDQTYTCSNCGRKDLVGTVDL